MTIFDMESSNFDSGRNSLSSDVDYGDDAAHPCLSLSQWKTYVLVGFYSFPICWFMVSELLPFHV